MIHSHLLGPLRHLNPWGPLLLALFFPLTALPQAGRIYTKPDPASQGAITGHIATELTHAIAIEHDRTRVFLAELADSGKRFQFTHLPTGKYDLLLVAKNGTVYEDLALGSSPALSEDSLKNAQKRVSLADTFFNQVHIHRMGASEDGETLLVFVERYRANDVLKQSGEALGQMVRRMEIVELTRATDDWQLTNSRHLYREGEPANSPHFLQSLTIPALGNIRIITEPKDLGEIPLPSSTE